MSKEENSIDEETKLPLSLLQQDATRIIVVKNHVYLYDDINCEVARNLFGALHDIAASLISASFDNNVPLPPIYIHINSYGGSVNDALAIVQGIRDIQEGRIHQINGHPIKIEIHTIIEGECDSAASLIACVGNRRFASKYSLSLLHDVRQIGGAGGKAEEIGIQANNLEMFKRKFYDIYLEHSKLTEKQLAEICSKEDYSTPEQLLEWGLVDEII